MPFLIYFIHQISHHFYLIVLYKQFKPEDFDVGGFTELIEGFLNALETVRESAQQNVEAAQPGIFPPPSFLFP